MSSSLRIAHLANNDADETTPPTHVFPLLSNSSIPRNHHVREVLITSFITKTSQLCQVALEQHSTSQYEAQTTVFAVCFLPRREKHSFIYYPLRNLDNETPFDRSVSYRRQTRCGLTVFLSEETQLILNNSYGRHEEFQRLVGV